MLSYRRIFPRLYIICTIASAVLLALDRLLAYWLTPGVYAADPIGTLLQGLPGVLLGVLVWIPYMLKSVRVKNTFVN
jgi:hypothetical protein